MDFECEERPSDSSLVEKIWRRQGGSRAESFISLAKTHWGMVVTRVHGKAVLTVRGPETRATPASSPVDAEFFAIMFKPGTVMTVLPARMLMDRHDLDLPDASSQSFWLQGSAWQFPDFDNADTFIARLAHAGLLVRDPIVSAVLQGDPVDVSLRSVQRRFFQATGLTHTMAREIERARYATKLLNQGTPILDVVFEAGYYDQPHLTRAVKRFIGLTPAQIMDKGRAERLSLLYKTPPF